MQGQPVKNLKEYKGEDRVISGHEMALKLKERPESIIQVKSLIPSLDEATEGFQDGELIGISGPTKHGKTLLAQSLTASFAKQQYHSLWFSFEVPPRQFLSQFPELPLLFLPQQLKAYAMDWIEERIQESFIKYHTRIVFLDNAHFLLELSKSRNLSIDLGQIAVRLKDLAVKKGFLIFLLCHTTKNASTGELSFESIRDSSLLPQTSDCVLMIKRTPDAGENTARLRVEFHRRTGVLEKVIELKKENGYLVELTKREEPIRKDLE